MHRQPYYLAVALHIVAVMDERHNILKVDGDARIVYGFAVVCEKDGEEYFDEQQDYIPEEEMLDAATTFMISKREARDLHSEEAAGMVVHSLPLTKDLAKALNIEPDRTGWIVGIRPDSDEVLKKYESGEYTGFSIAGNADKVAVI